MTEPYTSFLLCIRPSHTDVYCNGLPLGVIRAGLFEIQHNKMPDGTLVPVKIPEDLKAKVLAYVSALPL